METKTKVTEFLENYRSPATRRAYASVISKYSLKSEDDILAQIETPRERSILKTYFRYVGRDYEFLYRRILRTEPPQRYGTMTYPEAKAAILSDKFSSRQQIALGLMLFCGLRVNEVSGLRLVVRDHVLRVYGKGRKYRSVPIPTFLERTIRSSSSDTIDACDVTLRRWVQQVCAIARKKAYPHYLRKLYATQIYKTTPLAVVSKLLGHSNPATTMKYILEVDKDQMEKSMEAL